MDTIITSYLHKFIEEFELENAESEVSNNFEKLCSYVILSSELANPKIELTDLENVSTAKNKGIDSICLLIDGKLVTNQDEANDLLNDNRFFDILLIFIQSKTSDSFSDAELANFSDTIKDFLKEKPIYDMTSEVEDYHELLMILFSKFAFIKSFNSKAYYCCTGKWNENTSINDTRYIKEKEIKEEHEIFKNGDFIILPFDKMNLQKYYDKASAPLKTEFNFSNKVSLSNLPDSINEAYIGNIEFSEFKKIIIDLDTNKIRSLFYDNIRDDLGIDNDVNQKISKTLVDKKYSLFPLLNNGVTIIAEENNGSGNKFILDNFQVVNGCQTSNVIFNHMANSGIESLFVPIKLIITKDPDIKDDIIIATNQQTQIKEEQLLALSIFQKGLEKYYQTQSDKIFYERRLNQYKNTDIMKKNIVDLREQIKSFVAIFMEEPHLVSGYFSKIYHQNKEKLFKEDHKYEPYYFAGLIQFKFKELLTKKVIDRKYNKIRYHIFMLFRKIHESQEFKFNFLNQRKVQQYIKELVNSLNEKVVIENFNKVLELIDSSGIDLNKSGEIYKKSTTNILLQKFNEKYK